MTNPPPSVLVLGSSGVLGRRTLAWGRRHLPELRWVGAHRRAAEGSDTLALDLHQREKLQEALRDFDLLINAVGPYDYEPLPILEACAAAACHYCDLAELPEFFRAVEAAVNRLGEPGIAVVPGCSTSPGLLETMAQRFDGLAGVARIEARLSIGSRNPTSPGLVYGLLRPIGRSLPDGSIAFAKVHAHEGRCYGRYPYPSPDGCLAIGGHRVPLHFYAGFDRGLWVRGLVGSRRLWAGRSDEALARLSVWVSRLGSLVRPFGGTRGQLLLDAYDASETRASRIEIVASREGLDVPAQPPAWLAGVLAEEGCLSPGLSPLSDHVGFETAARWLGDSGVRVTRHPSEGF